MLKLLFMLPSQDLQKVIYMDNSTSALLDPDCTVSSGNTEKADPQTSENRTGIRTMCVSPDGQHLASGDRNGTLRYSDRRNGATNKKTKKQKTTTTISIPLCSASCLCSCGRQ